MTETDTDAPDVAQTDGADIDAMSDDLASDLFPMSSFVDETSNDLDSKPEDSSIKDVDKTKKVASTKEADQNAGQKDNDNKNKKVGDAAEIKSGTDADRVAQQRQVPKTWPKNMHQYWEKLPSEVQEYLELREKQMLDGIEQYKSDASYGKAMRDAVTPYLALIQAQGLDAPKAVQTLLNAHYRLSTGTPSQKQQYIQYIAKQYGVDLNGIVQSGNGANGQDRTYLNKLQDEIHSIKQALQQTMQSQLDAERARIEKEFDAFASDPAHPYVYEVADDLIALLRAGFSLQDAYDRAVWANPVTRAKEQARLQTEMKAEAEKKAREQAEAAKKASAANIRSRDTRRAPTEQSRGTMRNLENVLMETMRELKSTH